MTEKLIDKLMNVQHAYACVVDGVIQIHFIRNSEWELKKAILEAMGMFTNCVDPTCKCVDEVWAKCVIMGNVEIKPVTIQLGHDDETNSR